MQDADKSVCAPPPDGCSKSALRVPTRFEQSLCRDRSFGVILTAHKTQTMQIKFNPDSDEPGFGHKVPLLFNAVYCSRAAANIDAAAVDQIIAKSHRNNSVWGITGMLVFGSGIFFQWLEGPRANVLRLLDVLRSDNRHEQIIMLSEVEEARERLFPHWDMELVSADHIRDVLADALGEAKDPHDSVALQAMLNEIDARLGASS